MNAEVKPGYKKTEVGLIPKDWFVTTLGKSFGKITTGKLDANAMSASGEYPFFTCAKEVYRINHYAFDCDALLISGNGANVGYVHHHNGKFNAYQRTYVLTDANYDIRYLKVYTEVNLQERLRVEVNAGNTPYIVKGTLSEMLIGLPFLIAEQKVIASTLDEMDALIGSLDQLISKKHDIQQATMQQLLTGQRRLPGFSGEWDVKRLGDLCTLGMGRTPSRINDAYWGRGYKWLSIADLKAKVITESSEEITELAAKQIPLIKKGTLLMSFKLSIGRLAFAGCDLFTNEAICSFNELKANAEYLYYALQRVDFSLYGKQAVKGFTLNKASLQLVEVAIPTIEEQTAIVTILSDLDAELAALETRRDKAHQLKQGMMQELLTGRIRLV